MALDNAERGALLARVRDQLLMTTEANKMLYGSSIVFGVNKLVEAEDGQIIADADAATKIEALEADVHSLRVRIEAAQRRTAEAHATASKRREQELAALRSQTKHLESFLNSR